MPVGFLRQVIVPVPSGSNPLWLEKKEGGQALVRIISVILIIALFAASVAVVRDYANTKGPMDFECRLGFKDSGCPAGHRCVGNIVKCTDTNSAFKYRATSLVFPEKRCNSPRGYKEYCVKDAIPA